ncbi:MAG: hypothetical protein PGMFKBFP_01660 [Anaerolineales bacterium]|nr:hypothetical protein [Anaerolineales bacterium]
MSVQGKARPPGEDDPNEQNGNQRAGDLSKNQGPNAVACKGQPDGCHAFDNGVAHVGDELAAVVHIAHQQVGVDRSQRVDGKRGAQPAQDRGDRWFFKVGREKRRQRDNDQR